MTAAENLQRGEEWLNQHFPDWRQLIKPRFSNIPDADVTRVISYAMRTSAPEMGQEFIRFAWKIMNDERSEPPPVDRRLTTPTRRLLQSVVSEVVGSVLSYAESFGIPAGAVVEDVQDSYPDLDLS